VTDVPECQNTLRQASFPCSMKLRGLLEYVYAGLWEYVLIGLVLTSE